MKRYIFVFFMTLLLASCAVPQAQPITPTASTPTTAPASSTIVPITLTPEKGFVPKQNDLIFIEFFAIT
jgi:PBP1b-binding outer membrane lipoprotein LpoB